MKEYWATENSHDSSMEIIMNLEIFTQQTKVYIKNERGKSIDKMANNNQEQKIYITVAKYYKGKQPWRKGGQTCKLKQNVEKMS